MTVTGAVNERAGTRTGVRYIVQVMPEMIRLSVEFREPCYGLVPRFVEMLQEFRTTHDPAHESRLGLEAGDEQRLDRKP